MRKKKQVKKDRSNRKIFALFGIGIFILSIFGYAFLSSSGAPSSNNGHYIHWHATLSIEGENMSTLKTYSDFTVPPPLHLHYETTTSAIAILHMEVEGKPVPIKEFFKSIGFNTTDYVLYANDKEVSYNYIFKNGDILDLMLKKPIRNETVVNETAAKAFFNIFESGNITELKKFKP